MQTIHVIDPLNLTVLANITSDQYGLPLTNQAGGKNDSKLWNDAVFVQVRLHDPTSLERILKLFLSALKIVCKPQIALSCNVGRARWTIGWSPPSMILAECDSRLAACVHQ